MLEAENLNKTHKTGQDHILSLICATIDSRCVCPLHTASSYRLTSVLPSAPDMSQLKLGVRSVAGRLSVMASGVVSTIQVGQEVCCLN